MEVVITQTKHLIASLLPSNNPEQTYLPMNQNKNKTLKANNFRPQINK